jgi:Leucine-rich repeat (LRR) protein
MKTTGRTVFTYHCFLLFVLTILPRTAYSHEGLETPALLFTTNGLFCGGANCALVAGTGSSGTTNGPGATAAFDQPVGVATSPDATFTLIADSNNHLIRKLTLFSGVVSTFAGSGAVGAANGIGTNADFSFPHDISISSDGSFAVSVCLGGHRVRRFVLSTAAVSTVAGSPNAKSGISNGIGTNALFDTPTGICMMSNGLYALVADMTNNQLKRVDLATQQVSPVVGSITATQGSANGIGTSATLTSPYFVTISSDDSFAIVSEMDGHCLRKVVLSSWAVSSLAGTGSPGSANGVGTLASLYSPASIILTSDDHFAYVSDLANNQIRRVEISTKRVSTLDAQASSTALNQPVGLAWLTLDSILLVANAGDHRLLEVYGTCDGPNSAPSSFASIIIPSERKLSMHVTTYVSMEDAFLCDFLNSTNIATMTGLTGWSTCGTVSGKCTVGSVWTGLTCSSGVITGIDLNSKGLVGSLPSSIGSLTSLSRLYLHTNSFNGTLPSSIGSLTSLTTLYLYTNSFNGPLPSSIGSLTSLTYLSLNSNSFNGTLPSSIGSLTSLTYLGLSTNSFAGPLPSSIGSLTSLSNLNLHVNSLNGPLPSSIGSLTSLTYLGLSTNSFTGSLPSSIGSLTSLSYLSLWSNSFTGPLPSSIDLLLH